MGPLRTLLNREARALARARRIEDRGRALYERGAEARAAGQFLRALAVLEQTSSGVSSHRVEYAATFASIGAALYHLGRRGESERSVAAALALDPANPDALMYRGLVLAELGKTDEALSSFDRALGADPSRADAWGNKGDVLFGAGRYEEATNAWLTVLRLNPREV